MSVLRSSYSGRGGIEGEMNAVEQMQRELAAVSEEADQVEAGHALRCGALERAEQPRR